MLSRLNNFWAYLLLAVLLLAGMIFYHSSKQVIVIDEKQWTCSEDSCDVTFRASNRTGEAVSVRFYFRAMVWVDSSYGEILGVLFEDRLDGFLDANVSSVITHRLTKPRVRDVEVIQVSVAVLSD